MPAGLYLEEFEVGRVFEHAIRRTVTEMDNTLFSCLTHNPQPLHIDHDFAAKTEWGKPLVNSLFTLGLMIGISVNDTTLGTTVGNLGMTDVKFPKPVFHGDTLHVTTEVLAKRESQLAARCRHRRVPAQGLQPARRAGGRMPPPGHDAQDDRRPEAHALAAVHSRRRREEARQGRGHRRRRADPRSGGRGERAAQGGRARDRRAVHRRDARHARGGPLLYVRINALDTDLWEDDVAGIAGALPDGILLPKARSGEDVHTLSIALNHAEERAGAQSGSTRIIALVTETPISLLQLAHLRGLEHAARWR